MSKLPLKVQVGLRDYWNKDDAPVQKARLRLKELIGVDVEIEPEWHLLVADLDPYYPDKSTFVPSVAACVQSWCDCLAALVDDEANAEWADTLVEKINRTLRVFVTVSKNEELVLSWSAERTGFVVALPRGPLPSFLRIHMDALFKGSLLNCFAEKATSSALGTRTSDDWADVSINDKTGKPDVLDTSNTQSSRATSDFDTLPDIGTLPRPDDLLLNPPYHLVVCSRGTSSVEVQCSHSPTLQLLSEYLKKWCRANSQDTQRPPGVEINLHQSAFGLGLIYDRLTMSAEGRHAQFAVSPMTVLSLVEGVLGYKSVAADATCWVFLGLPEGCRVEENLTADEFIRIKRE